MKIQRLNAICAGSILAGASRDEELRVVVAQFWPILDCPVETYAPDFSLRRPQERTAGVTVFFTWIRDVATQDASSRCIDFDRHIQDLAPHREVTRWCISSTTLERRGWRWGDSSTLAEFAPRESLHSRRSALSNAAGPCSLMLWADRAARIRAVARVVIDVSAEVA